MRAIIVPLSVMLALAAPVAALATPRSVSLTVTPKPSAPILGQPTPPTDPAYTETLAYDQQAGTVVITENGTVSIDYTDDTGERTLQAWPGFGAIQFSHCPQTPGPGAPDLTLSTDSSSFLPLAPYADDPNGLPVFTLEDSAVDGSLPDTSSISSGPPALTLTWADQNLRGLNLTCVFVNGKRFDFDGYSPTPPSYLFDALLRPGDATVPPGVIEHYDCPLKTGGMWQCATEYHVGKVWRYATGVVKVEHGTRIAHVTNDSRWVRRWHHDSRACLAGWGLHGSVSSNFPCAADQLAHGDKHMGRVLGTGTGSWPWLYNYPCHTQSGVTTCTNAAGDSYRFRELPVYVGMGD